MPEQERQYVTVDGKRYPLKTESERAASQAKPTQTESSSSHTEAQVSQSEYRSYNVSVPAGNATRTVVLAMLVSFGTYALAGDAAYRKLSGLQGYLGKSNAPADAQTAKQEMGGEFGTTGFSVFSARSIFGWMSLITMLLVLSDFDATSELAKSFALLIMLTTLITLGPDALANLGKLTSGVTK